MEAGKAMREKKTNREVITGSDFKRMVSGAYSEFLLEYDRIDHLTGAGRKPGTQILRTMGAAIVAIDGLQDTGIGALSRRFASAAILGARGSTGVTFAQMFRGIAKGLAGKYNATSSEFGKAFQYGILYAQRIIPEEVERPIITLAKAVAKGTYKAVREDLPIIDILEAATKAGEKHLEGAKGDAGANILFSFFAGCRKGLDGNFVSPAMSLGLGLASGKSGLKDPRADLVRPYCMSFSIRGGHLDEAALRRELSEVSPYLTISRSAVSTHVHIHTEKPGEVLERSIGWGRLGDVHLINMSEPHVLRAENPMEPVALAAIAADAAEAETLEARGVRVVLMGDEGNCPSVAELVEAVHSDVAEAYVLVAYSPEFRLVAEQAKRLLGERLEVVLCPDRAAQENAIGAFKARKTAEENAAAMRSAIG